MKWAAIALFVAACGTDEAVQMTVDAGTDDDPLHVTDTPAPGSLDDLHARIIAKRCSGQPGLCHNGQFEPNLSTPAMTYAYLVRRPSNENPTRLRVNPGDPASSQLIDKLRNRNGVSTQMPLGGEPLEEADIAALEAWITAGALREPGAMPAPVLNNPPKRPEIAIYNNSGVRLDGTGPVMVSAGAQLVFRHSVQDFETPDPSIPFAAVLLTAADGRTVALNPGANDPSTGQTTYDAAGPMGKGDQLDYMRAWTVPSMLPLFDRATGTTTSVSASGQTLSVLVVYVDQATTGIAVFDVSTSQVVIQ
jgi:hypothetical protein